MNNTNKDSLEILMSNEDDVTLLNEIALVKSNIIYHIGVQNLVNKVIELIDESSIIDFKSQRNKKYINIKRPLFIVKLAKSDKQIKEVYPDLQGVSDMYNVVSECVHRDIISKLSDYIVSNVKDKGLLEELLNKEVNDDLFEASTLISFLTASIFSINCDFDNNTIYLEYMV